MNKRRLGELLCCVWLQACAYESQYVAPIDGRARVVWEKDHAVMQPPAQISPPCEYELLSESLTTTLHFASGDVDFTPPVVIDPAIVSPPFSGARLTSGFFRGHGAGKSLAAMLVAALLVLPAIDLGLAIDRPEAREKTAEAIDQANAYNDLARSPNSTCFRPVQQ